MVGPHGAAPPLLHQAWVYAQPFDAIGNPALLVEDWVLRDMLKAEVVVFCSGPHFDQHVLTQKGRDQLAAGLLERDGTAYAMAVALCGSLAKAVATRRQSS